MPVINRIAEFHPEITEWRRHLHANPELLFDTHKTSAFVAQKLREFGCDEVVEGIGRTGVVGLIRGKASGSGKVIGMRADMDALPITERRTDVPHKSTNPGVMHACGHDGHTAMLLGAAKYMAETRNFDGAVAVIFQPAEEGGGGGKEMVDDGMMERFGINEVYGMHNWPGFPEGSFWTRPGPVMAAADQFDFRIVGKGAHAAKPHEGRDPIQCAVQMVSAFQTIVSRNLDPLESLVISVTKFIGGTAHNVIPGDVTISGTVRTLTDEVRELAEQRMRGVALGIAAAHDCEVEIDYRRGYPVVVNHEAETEFAASVARTVVGEDKVRTDATPVMGGEDFAYMLEARPGNFVFIGQGDTAGVHHPDYDFNDDIIPLGATYWAKLAETAMPAG
ncbi:M20 aminoacylase family protein [Oceanicella sp. SM1341]|uniref:M20 aminoacylase family protein n=1 Tax=Oceanicella sp. SM1341 TaxID=1548889 RepID=UPI000E54E73E|nr:M20 aminoacylase family protein [Oceanicella sp. SM1341]